MYAYAYNSSIEYIIQHRESHFLMAWVSSLPLTTFLGLVFEPRFQSQLEKYISIEKKSKRHIFTLHHLDLIQVPNCREEWYA